MLGCCAWVLVECMQEKEVEGPSSGARRKGTMKELQPLSAMC